MAEQPGDYCYTILQDHGPDNEGWGPALIAIPGIPPAPAFYTGTDEATINGLRRLAENLASITGQETRFCRYSNREDLVTVPRS